MVLAADHAFMARALRLAARGLYTTAPNPRVGCVIVKNGQVIGEGWHECAGGPHAEIAALQAAAALNNAVPGATLYVTLEPCHHRGRTPPCDEAVVAAGIKRAVIAMQDPDSRTAGRGINCLRQNDVDVEIGIMEAEARDLNIGFVSRLTRGRPWVRAKIAASLDGATALADGESRWLTGRSARRDAWQWRARANAILTGSGTVRADDPRLTVREIAVLRQPLRVVADSKFATASDARILEGGGVLIVGAKDNDRNRVRLHTAGAETMVLANSQKRVDLRALLEELGRREVNELHVEAGATLNGALLELGLVDELLLYFAPCVLGNKTRGMFALTPLANLDARYELQVSDVRKVGSDLRVLAKVERR